jgi:hypothetical protein
MLSSVSRFLPFERYYRLCNETSLRRARIEVLITIAFGSAGIWFPTLFPFFRFDFPQMGSFLWESFTRGDYVILLISFLAPIFFIALDEYSHSKDGNSRFPGRLSVVIFAALLAVVASAMLAAIRLQPDLPTWWVAVLSTTALLVTYRVWTIVLALRINLSEISAQSIPESPTGEKTFTDEFWDDRGTDPSGENGPPADGLDTGQNKKSPPNAGE